MSLDLSTLKVGDRVTYADVTHTAYVVTAIGEQTFLYRAVRPVGRPVEVQATSLDHWSLLPPPPLIDPEQVWWISPDRQIEVCGNGDDCGPYHTHGVVDGTPHPHFRITATEPVT